MCAGKLLTLMKIVTPWKKFLYRCEPFKGAALIIFLALVVTVPGFSQTPTPAPQCVYAVLGSMTITNAGRYYAVGDRIRAVGGIGCLDNFPLSLEVTAVDANGAVTTATIIDADSNGYFTLPPSPISFGGSATGSDFKATFIFAPH